MSLHDIDKNNSSRITPILNSADDVAQRMAQGTAQVQNSVEGEDDRGLRTLERQILAVQDGTNKAVMGFYGVDNKFGFKVAEDGVDVLTATDDQLIFNSEQNVFKIISTLTINIPNLPASSPGATSSDTQVIDTGIPTSEPLAIVGYHTYAVSDGYNPMPRLAVQLDSSATPQSGGIRLHYAVYSSVTSGSLVITSAATNYSTTTASGASSVKVFIMQETAN